eukprot:IDg5728t1
MVTVLVPTRSEGGKGGIGGTDVSARQCMRGALGRVRRGRDAFGGVRGVDIAPLFDSTVSGISRLRQPRI